MSHYNAGQSVVRDQPGSGVTPGAPAPGTLRLHRRVAALLDGVARCVRHHRRPADEGVGVLPRRRPGPVRRPSWPPHDGWWARVTCGWTRSAGTVAFDAAGVELDLGGIAKGYAVDRAVSILRARGVTAALVSAGRQHRLRTRRTARARRAGTSTSRIRWTSGGARRPCALRDRVAVDRRPLGEVVRGRRRSVLAHHGPAHRRAGAGHADGRGAQRQRHRRRRTRRRAVRARTGGSRPLLNAVPGDGGTVLSPEGHARMAPGAGGERMTCARRITRIAWMGLAASAGAAAVLTAAGAAQPPRTAADLEASAFAPRTYVAPRLSTAPTIDGRLDDAAWKRRGLDRRLRRHRRGAASRAALPDPGQDALGRSRPSTSPPSSRSRTSGAR